MKIIITLAALLILGVTIYFLVLGHTSKSKAPPSLVSKQLSHCLPKPNCVRSENATEAQHYVAPIPYPSRLTSVEIIQNAIAVLENMGGTIVSENDSYVAATFTSRLFGFIDDFEIRLDEGRQLVHMRSAARVGHSDMGVNKKRVEVFRKKLLFDQ